MQYTHVGRLGYTGHYSVGLDACRTPGKRHALNLDSPRVYRSLCGVPVPLDSDDHQLSGQNEVKPVGQSRVTCKRCLKRIKVD